ncbi:MAG: hypothetical protein C5B49_09975 [Bdellovibrio sp.]|nr:MAG: hypothetical protein C5B49_09975 [Bdellovibrio sp.]
MRTHANSILPALFIILVLFPIYGRYEMPERFAQPFSGFIDLGTGHKVYATWEGLDIQNKFVILLNGLTHSTKNWQQEADELKKRGVGVIRLDFPWQGHNLDVDGFPTEPITDKETVEVVRQFLSRTGLNSPVNLVGLSYGGGIAIRFAATYPELVNKIFLESPYTEALQAQDDLIKWLVDVTWFMAPTLKYLTNAQFELFIRNSWKSMMWWWNMMGWKIAEHVSQPYLEALVKTFRENRKNMNFDFSTKEGLYNFYFKLIVYATYPLAEPEILEHPYKIEATYWRALGIRDTKMIDFASTLPKDSVHLMIAGNDQYIPRKVLLQGFWDRLPLEVKGSVVVINGSKHSSNEEAPLPTAAWIAYNLHQNEVRMDVVYYVDRNSAVFSDAQNGGATLDLTLDHLDQHLDARFGPLALTQQRDEARPLNTHRVLKCSQIHSYALRFVRSR